MNPGLRSLQSMSQHRTVCQPAVDCAVRGGPVKYGVATGVLLLLLAPTTLPALDPAGAVARVGAAAPFARSQDSRPAPTDGEARELSLAWNQRGIVAKKEGRTRDAIAAFEKALEYAPGEDVLIKNLASAWNDEGVRCLEKEGNPDLAITAFERSLKIGGEDSTVKLNKAAAHDRRGTGSLTKKQFDAALAEFRAAIALDPASGRYPTQVALVYYTREDFDTAASELEGIVRKFTKETDAWVLLGETCYKKNDMRRALECFEAALKLEPARPGLAARVERVRKESSVEADFVPQNSSHFQFHFPPKRPDLQQSADFVASILEDAYFTVGRTFDIYPDGRTQVIFYEVKDFSSVTRADEWVGALYDGKIRVPLRDLEKQRDTLKRTLVHEYTHRVIHFMAGPKCPTWLNEGLAQWMEEAGVVDAEKRIREKPELLLTAAELRSSFVGKLQNDRARAAYDQSLSLTRYLLDSRGCSSVVRYLRSLQGDGTKPAPAEPAAFEEEFRMTFEELLGRWRLANRLQAER